MLRKQQGNIPIDDWITLFAVPLIYLSNFPAIRLEDAEIGEFRSKTIELSAVPSYLTYLYRVLSSGAINHRNTQLFNA